MMTWKAAWLAAVRGSAFNKPVLPFLAGVLSGISLCLFGSVGVWSEAGGVFGLMLGAGIGQMLIMAAFLRPPRSARGKHRVRPPLGRGLATPSSPFTDAERGEGA